MGDCSAPQYNFTLTALANVHTPKHGSWLNLVETLFGKMVRTFLRHIRVDSKAELKERILKGIAEINAAPVIHRWKKFADDSAVVMQILL